MAIRVLAVGKKHERWIEEGLTRYLQRLRKPFDVTWQLLPHSPRDGEAARREESARILEKVERDEIVLLFDERGTLCDSVEFSRELRRCLETRRRVTMVIGGAYGVTASVRERADTVVSLSRLVFPHQLVRLIIAEQIYRAQEITTGGQYHHV